MHVRYELEFHQMPWFHRRQYSAAAAKKKHFFGDTGTLYRHENVKCFWELPGIAM